MALDGILKYAKILLLMVFTSISLTSCIFEDFDNENESPDNTGTTMVFRLNTVNSGTTRVDVEEVERIHTLRIVITDADDNLEINNYYPDVSDRDFYSDLENLFIITNVKPGNKYVYFFANEEAVTDINWKYKGLDEITALHGLLEWATGMPAHFGENINSVNFSLKPENINKFGLPYSSVYEIYIEGRNRNEHKFYLVPVATKFRINLYNYRSQVVTLNELSISSLADKTFLMGSVGKTDQQKSLPGQSEKRYWVDWLHDISEISWNYGEPVWNEWFNNQYGWISNYELPDETNHISQPCYYDDPTIRINSESYTYPKVLGPYYFHESKADSYSIKCSVVNYSNTITRELNIEGLKYLFRNTFVDLDIIFSESQPDNISIKYTVCPWYTKDPVDITFD